MEDQLHKVCQGEGSGSTTSKALVKSMNIAPVGILLSGVEDSSLLISKEQWLSKKLGLKPDWYGDLIWKSLTYGDTWLKINFLNIFATQLIMEMGL